ncbi:MAG TPA: FUSC family protein [Micromonosporaceae bacterium]
MRRGFGVRAAALGVTPLLLTVLSLMPLAAAYHLGAGVVVLGAAVCLAAGSPRRAGAGDRTAVGRTVSGWRGLAAQHAGSVLATTLGVGALAVIFSYSLWLGDAIYVAVLIASRLVGRFGPRWAALGRVILLPLTALFLAPPIRVAGHSPLAGLGWALLACLVASVWLVAVRQLLVRPVAGEPEPVDPAEAPSTRARTRLALASTIAVTAGLLVGQVLFPEHWPWAVITVITVSLSSRSRGEVLLRSGSRLLGALIATALASPAAALLAPHPAATVVTILVVLALGWGVRERSRVVWTAALTASLAFLATLGGATGTWSLLGLRLLAIAVGGVCAIGPALLLAPHTRDVLRKRTAICLRRLRACLDEPTPVALRRFETALAELRDAEAPLRVARRLARLNRPELAWYASLAAALPELRALAGAAPHTSAGEPLVGASSVGESSAGESEVVSRLRRLMGSIASQVRGPAPAAGQL